MPPTRRARTTVAAAPSPTSPGEASFRSDFHQAVYDCVRRIPEGSVCSYGQIATLIGHPRHSRMVGAALKVLPRRLALPFLPPRSPSDPGPEPEPEPEPNPAWVPWHRVVSSSGLISPRGNPAATARQAEWLVAEGVVVRSVDGGDKVSMAVYGWKG
ncbi:hypothetical protein JCM3770_000728 [Rhodotorula araucariae]